MALVPGGVFWLGSELGEPDERRVTEVELSPFYMDRTVVTVKDYRECVEAGGCPPPATTVEGKFYWYDKWISGRYCYGARNDRDRYPMTCISWFDSDAYCKWAGKRLPTEAEWEFAAKGTDCRRYPWGHELPTSDRAVWNSTVGVFGAFANDIATSLFKTRRPTVGTAEVAIRPAGASPFGIEDMAGNVWEWASDWYAPNYPGGRVRNPTGPETGERRIHRGGGWTDTEPRWLRTTDRGRHPPTIRYNRVGFRCVQPVESATP